jgi:hypothetical protein
MSDDDYKTISRKTFRRVAASAKASRVAQRGDRRRRSPRLMIVSYSASCQAIRYGGKL